MIIKSLFAHVLNRNESSNVTVLKHTSHNSTL